MDWKHTAATTLMFLKSNQVAGELVTTSNDFGPELNEEDYPSDVCWGTVSFMLLAKDKDRPFVNLVEEYFEPAAIALSQASDKVILQALAVEARNRVGTPGNGIMPVLPTLRNDQRLVVGTNAEAQMLMGDAAFSLRRPGERDGTRLSEAQMFEQVWVDQNCPSVYTDTGGWEEERGLFRVYDRKEIGDISLLFEPDSAVVTYFRLKELEGDEIVNFAGRLLRLRVKDDGEDIRVTVDSAFRVDVNPHTTTAIYS